MKTTVLVLLAILVGAVVGSTITTAIAKAAHDVTNPVEFQQ